MSASHFHAMACNNAWANHRLLLAVGRLDRNELERERTGFFPSIVATLNHILIVDWYYVDALEEGSLGTSAFEQEIPFPRFEDLNQEQRAVDRRLIAYTKALTSDALASRVRMIRRDRIQTDRADRVLLHLFQHQIHHRGQIHCMLSGTDLKPPQLDEFFMSDEAELRANDLSRLGLSESEIWQPDLRDSE